MRKGEERTSRIATAAILFLLLVSALSSSFNVHLARASGTVHIRADGSIDPPTAPIQRDGDVYTLFGNVTSDADGIVIERNDTILDGAGWSIEGTGNALRGIYLSDTQNVTVRNTKVRLFEEGIYLMDRGFNTIWNNSAEENRDTGIRLLGPSCDNSISENYIRNNSYGMYLFDSSGNSIYDNNITDNGNGIRLYSSSSNLIYHNNFTRNAAQASTYDSISAWDNSYPSGGNHWSDYDGIDEKSGPNQDQPGSDGIGDSSYIIDANNRDRYPLPNNYSAIRLPAPNGVHQLATYESRIGEQGLLIEDENIQMWVPARYANHSHVIFAYLVAGYLNLTSLFGNHQFRYKFSIEHYPPGSPYFWGGTDALGTVRYGYENLEDNTPEWNLYGVPHMAGYYEEMAHCFCYDFGLGDDGWGGQNPNALGGSVGYYETLGLMIGGCETTMRAAYNPYVEQNVLSAWRTCNETTTYYLQHNTGPPEVTDNIWPTRVMTDIFKTEVVDVYGWDALSRTFNYLQRQGYPLRQYERDHTWGGFLNYLANQTGSDLNTVFGGYGLPLLQWFGENGYWKGIKQIDNSYYSFHVRCFDREGIQPSSVKLRIYHLSGYTTYGMNLIGGNNQTGWMYEVNVTYTANSAYAFITRDGANSILQAVGSPTAITSAPTGVAVTDINPYRTIVGNKTTTSINVTAANQGDETETFNVTLYFNTTTIGTQSITVNNGSSATLNFSWNTTDLPLGNYTLRAEASQVPGETDTADNILSSTIQVSILGDINGDGKVDMRDVAYVARRFNTDPSKPLWDSNTDVNEDGKIDMRDIATVAKEFKL